MASYRGKVTAFDAGTDTVVLEAEYASRSEEDRLARAHELIGLRQVAPLGYGGVSRVLHLREHGCALLAQRR